MHEFSRVAWGALRTLSTVACSTLPFGCPRAQPSVAGAASGSPSSSVASSAPADASSDSPSAATSTSASASSSGVAVVIDPPRAIGPYETPFLGKRNVWFVIPPAKKKGGHRLLANLHGVCNPPGYACGYWADTGASFGFLVCPTGNDTCGPSMFNAPTWTESDLKIDDDLELAIAKVESLYPDEIDRSDAVLTGFSRGAYVAVKIAAAHPGRWPYLIFNEASVSLSVPALKAAKVRAVALIAGEIGSQVASERKTVQALTALGYPAKLWVMPKAGHFYSSDIADIMREAIEFVTSYK